MEKNKNVEAILRQFRKKSKRIINKDYFTEFFYINKNRKVIEFLFDEKNNLLLEKYLKKFIEKDFKEFIKISLINDEEEEIKTWFYEKEDLIINLQINWGFKKQEICLQIDIENFIIEILDQENFCLRKIDYNLLNDYLISFITNQAKTLSESFKILSKK